MKHPIRLLIADDSHFIREALRNVIAQEPSIELVAEAKDGAEALALIAQHQPDIVLLDISMRLPEEGFEVARQLRQRTPLLKIIYFSGQDYSAALLRAFVHRALSLQAAGFVLKSSSTAEIIESIQAVAAGEERFSSRLTQYLLDLHQHADTIERQYPSLKDLSDTNCQLLLLLAEAKTSKEIATELNLAPRTIENHRNDLCERLGFKGHNLLLKFAIEHKTELLALFSAKR